MAKPRIGQTVLLINPSSGGVSPDTINKLTQLANLYSLKVISLDDIASIETTIMDLLDQGVLRLIVASGDGTIRLIAQSLLNKNIELAIIPVGTANLLALNSGIPTNLEQAFSLALTRQAKAFNCGLVNNQLFLIAVGIGLDAKVMANVTDHKKGRLGILAYLTTAIGYLADRSEKFSVISDKQVINCRAKMIMVANLGRLPVGITVAPQATLQRADLQLIIVQTQSLLDWINLAFWLLRGQPQRSRAYQGQSVTKVAIQCAKAQIFECDGDSLGKTDRLDIEFKPQALRLVYGDI